MLGISLGLSRITGKRGTPPPPPEPKWGFSPADWTLTPAAGLPRITLVSMPEPIEGVEVTLDGGATWSATGIDAAGETFTITSPVFPVAAAIRPVYDGGKRGLWSAPKVAARPVFTTPPGFSTSTPHEGEPLTLYLGAASGPGAVTIDLYALALAGVDVSGDVSGLSYTPDAAGTLAIRTRATNLWGATLSAIVTAEVTAAPEPTVWDVDLVGTSLIINSKPALPAAPVPPVFGWPGGNLIITG